MKLIVSYPGYVARHMCIVKWTPKDSVRKAVLNEKKTILYHEGVFEVLDQFDVGL